MKNSLRVIHPYKLNGSIWVFDDPAVGIIKEPFVAGADVILDAMTFGMADTGTGFDLVFSDIPFPGFSYLLYWRRKEFGGDWYYSAELDKEGWLCPALLHYFDFPPKDLYVQIRAPSNA